MTSTAESGHDAGHLRPWGPWATIGWTLVAFLGSEALTILVLLVIDPSHRLGTGMNNGRLLAVSTMLAMPFQIAVLLIASRLCGWSPREYLALRWPGRHDVIVALLGLVATGVALDLILYGTGRELVTQWQIETYSSAKADGWLWPLGIAVVLLAPIGEEIAFRGFLYRGLARPGREPLAIAAIALAWAAIHIQYDWVGILQVFVIGLLLGWVRWRSGSSTLTMAMHMLFNAEAAVETAIKVEWLT